MTVISQKLFFMFELIYSDSFVFSWHPDDIGQIEQMQEQFFDFFAFLCFFIRKTIIAVIHIAISNKTIKVPNLISQILYKNNIKIRKTKENFMFLINLKSVATKDFTLPFLQFV